MKTIIALLLLCAVSLSAQMVQCWPTNYYSSVLIENDVGRLWSVWRPSTRETITLGSRILVVSHIVYFDSALFGSKFGAPQQSEERTVYRQIGGTTYRPVGAEMIIRYGKSGLATTNYYGPEGMENLQWAPSAVGTLVVTDGLRRETRISSPLTCWGRNLSSEPYLVRFECGSPFDSFNYDFRFERNQIKVFTLDLINGQRFTVDFENSREWPLAF